MKRKTCEVPVKPPGSRASCPHILEKYGLKARVPGKAGGFARTSCSLLIACCVLALWIPGVCADKNPSPEQLIALHLKSIGDPALLPKIESIAFTGTAEVEFLRGSFGNLRGASILVSQGPKMAITMEFSSNYHGEYIACDGKNVTVKNYDPGQRTPLADFLYVYNKIMKNGLLGGVYSNAWPLLDIGRNPASMKIRKTKVKKTELYELEYRPKDYHTDMRIRMYFDTETFRHVRTHYYLGYGSAGYNTEPTLTETFEDFKKVGNLTLPHSYVIQLDRGPYLANWKIYVSEWTFNMPGINPKIFQAE